MKRGEIWLINLDPTVGAEVAKKRPELIVSVDGVGRLALRIVAWMVALPSNDVTGLDKASSADCFQVRSISENWMISRIGNATPEQMEGAEHGLRVVLGRN